MTYELLTEDAAKTRKGEALGYLTGILYLTPDLELCPASTPACRAACLHGAGKGRFQNVRDARKRRTARYKTAPDSFAAALVRDIGRLKRRADRLGMRPAFRFNGTSDIAFNDPVYREATRACIGLGIQQYEYTKRLSNVALYSAWNGQGPGSLTYSVAEPSPSVVRALIAENDAIADGSIGLAVVFDIKKKEQMPDELFGLPVIDGDRHDLRFRDAIDNPHIEGRPYIVGLRLKHTKNDAAARNGGFAV